MEDDELQKQQEDRDKETERQLDLIRQLAVNEAFRAWVDTVVKPGIELLEAELSSKEADQMPEAILRGKLKHVSSLKFYFEDVFRMIAQQ